MSAGGLGSDEVSVESSYRGSPEEKKMEAGRPTNLPSFSSLPYELIFNVLKYLPAQTLLRCRCVCKDWNSIITCQSFINAHLLSQPEGHLFFHFYEPGYQTSDKTQLCSFFPDESFSLVHKFKDPLPYSSQQEPDWTLVGSLNGLLCHTDWKPYGRKLYLWNPAIRKFKTLSNTCFKGKHHQRYVRPEPETYIVLGLGFRVCTSDYKIIRIASFERKSRPLHQVEAYSLSTDSWKRVGFSGDISRRLISIVSREYVHLSGYLNWMAMFSDGEGRPYESILSFDVNKEEFREIKLPRDYKYGINPIYMRVAIHRGLLAVLVSTDPTPEDENEYVWLWTMEDYGKVDSWRRTTVTTTAKTRRPRIAMGCTLDGRIIFGKGGGIGRIVELLDMETLQEQQFSIPDFLSVHIFKETLVPLEGANVVCE